MAASLFTDYAKQGEAEMELMQLEMLVAVAEEQSFLRAAERVFRTQPAVSIAIRKLETKIGVPLLDRSRRKAGRLTPAGERLYEYARRILELRDEAIETVGERNPSEGTLRVGLVGEESLNRFPALWRWFKELHPGHEAKIHADSLSVVLEELSAGRLDVALVSGRPRCESTGRNLCMTRLQQLPCGGWLWVVRPKLGKSAPAHAFETTLAETVPAHAAVSKPKGAMVRRLRVVR